ncbi:MAG: hypothetical protein RJA19_1605 [Bacteroidota bacterium]
MNATDALPSFDQWVDDLLEQQFIDVQGWIPAATLEALAAQLEHDRQQGRFRQAHIGKGAGEQMRSEIRSDQIAWWPDLPTDPAQRDYIQALESWWTFLNRTCFTTIRGGEFHGACYPIGASYGRHLDQFRGDRSRVISVITYLNPHWTDADGGELVLYTRHGEARILPHWGRTVMFRSEELEHEVLPGRRERRSITGWLR